MKEHKDRHLFHSTAEWEYFLRLGASKHEKSEKLDFYNSVIEEKRRNPAMNLLEAFPREEPKVTEKDRVARQYCDMILSVLKKHDLPVE